jgi:hypothetical protein
MTHMIPAPTTAQKIKFARYDSVETIKDYIDFLDGLESRVADQIFRQTNSGWPDREGYFGKVAELPIHDGFFESNILPVSQERTPTPLVWDQEYLCGQQNASPIEYNLREIADMVVDAFDIEEPFVQLSCQKPGMVHAFHFDDLKTYYKGIWTENDPSRKELKFNRQTLWAEVDDRFAIKFMIPLTDWRYGHIFQFGMKYWDNWRAGDVVIFDWQNLPHGTANASFYDRPMVRVSAIARYSDPRHDIFRT